MRKARTVKHISIIVVVAVLFGLPTLRGGFVGADDHRLVLNHVLVNHPSFSHAVELFRIVHRDLYQPLPLLTFAMEFAVAKTLHLFDNGVQAGAWLFHLDNVLLHALNAVLVYLLARRFREITDRQSLISDFELLKSQISNRPANRNFIALAAALLFAVHPLQVEVVAWVNGRMMLLSTMFVMLTILSLSRCLQSGGFVWAVVTVLCTLLCALCKIRVELPLLMFVAPLLLRRFGPRFWSVWLVALGVTAVFAKINIDATSESGFFEGGASQLQGPPLVRSLHALAWYIEHYLWPTGLASWYPAPGVVQWFDGQTLLAALIVLPLLFLAILLWRWSRFASLGLLWFFVALFSTLPLFPARNTLAADRYMYLPIVGLVCATGAGMGWIQVSTARRRSDRFANALTMCSMIVIVTVLTAVGWHTASYYENALLKTRRLAELFPDTPHVWERLAWAYYDEGQFEKAIECARREFAHDDPLLHSDANQAIGMAQFKLGRQKEALASLDRAVELGSESSRPRYRLATVYEELGLMHKAIPLFEETCRLSPLYNPGIIRLASAYRRVGRTADARAMYVKAFENNMYEVPAILGFIELDIEAGTPASLQTAERTIWELLHWMPENVPARVNLGVIQQRKGQTDEAIKTYKLALEQDPRHVTAAVNLAQVYESRGDVEGAKPWMVLAAKAGVDSFDQLLVVHDFLIAQGSAADAVAMCLNFSSGRRGDPNVFYFCAWSRAMAGELRRAQDEAMLVSAPSFRDLGWRDATLAFVSLSDGLYDEAVGYTERLVQCPTTADARLRLLRALEEMDMNNTNNPWTYYLAAILLIEEGKKEAAAFFGDLFEKNCKQPECAPVMGRLRNRLGSTKSD